jgi:hypothetical protein
MDGWGTYLSYIAGKAKVVLVCWACFLLTLICLSPVCRCTISAVGPNIVLSRD